MQIMKQADVESAPMPDLVETYNFLTGKGIKKFESVAVGRKRVLALMVERGLGAATDPKPVMPGLGARLAENFSPAAPERVVPTINPLAHGRLPPLRNKNAKGKKTTSKSDATDRIVVVEKTNPKRPGTTAHAEYELYFRDDCKSVKDYVGFGGQLSYLSYDVKRGFIRVESLEKTAKTKGAPKGG